MAAAQMRITQLQAQLGITAAPRTHVVRTSGTSFDTSFTAAVAEVAESAPTGDAKAVLGHYGNGQLPSDVLVPIGNGKERLWGPAASAFNRMASAAWEAGIDLKVNDGYRPLADQERLADELGLYSQGGKAAVPGTSTHGWGVSVDVDTGGGAVGWLRANAARFGFAEDVAREPWHWTWSSGN